MSYPSSVILNQMKQQTFRMGENDGEKEKKRHNAVCFNWAIDQ